MDREPQKFEEVLERTSKNARAIGDQNLKFVSGGDLQPTSEDCSPLSLAQDAETRLRTYRRPRKQAGKVRLKQVVADINAEHDVAGLCRELPDRVAKLDELEGGRLPK